LHGTKILVRGNHDHSTDTYYKDVGFSQVFTGPIFIKQGKIILSHEPAKEALNNEFVINIYGHLHNSYLNLKNFITVSAKMVHYTPQNIDQLLGEYEKTNGPLSDRSEDFTEEWYAPYVVQTEGQWAGKTPD
jgi:calcineurin-like phosphoesterase family protein